MVVSDNPVEDFCDFLKNEQRVPCRFDSILFTTRLSHKSGLCYPWISISREIEGVRHPVKTTREPFVSPRVKSFVVRMYKLIVSFEVYDACKSLPISLLELQKTIYSQFTVDAFQDALICLAMSASNIHIALHHSQIAPQSKIDATFSAFDRFLRRLTDLSSIKSSSIETFCAFNNSEFFNGTVHLSPSTCNAFKSLILRGFLVDASQLVLSNPHFSLQLCSSQLTTGFCDVQKSALDFAMIGLDREEFWNIPSVMSRILSRATSHPRDYVRKPLVRISNFQPHQDSVLAQDLALCGFDVQEERAPFWPLDAVTLASQ